MPLAQRQEPRTPTAAVPAPTARAPKKFGVAATRSAIPVEDGSLYAARTKIKPQLVRGTFRRIKWMLLAVALGVYYLVPFLRWHRGEGEPSQAVLLDLDRGRFYLFSIELWPQDVTYVMGLLILAALILFLMNAVAGRIWCGYLCPQTVWTDLFLAVERMIEGDRRERLKLDAAPWSAKKIALRSTKHAIWLLIAWWTGGAWVLYFADAPTLVGQLATFQAPPVAAAAILTLTAATYLLAGHMREQVCTYMCPWPRIQAALTDEHAYNILYRDERGEPRVSAKKTDLLRAAGQPAGDCIDCFACVTACPAGIDIRNGLQMDCIQCGLCIDACDGQLHGPQRPARPQPAIRDPLRRRGAQRLHPAYREQAPGGPCVRPRGGGRPGSQGRGGGRTAGRPARARGRHAGIPRPRRRPAGPGAADLARHLPDHRRRRRARGGECPHRPKGIMAPSIPPSPTTPPHLGTTGEAGTSDR